jgi:hypothetical protein
LTQTTLQTPALLARATIFFWSQIRNYFPAFWKSGMWVIVIYYVTH